MVLERQRRKRHRGQKSHIHALGKQTLPLTGEDLGTSPGLPSVKVMLGSL